jgi:hypothetical protein
MQWFGSPWPSADYRAPVCEDDAMRVPPPAAGEECVLCGLDFKPDAKGVVMPHLAADWTTEQRYCHLGCLLGNVGGEGISFRSG